MTPRKFLAALALGLPASVLAHGLTFGSEHTLGGDAHTAVLNATLAAICATMAALCGTAIFLATGTRNGSIVAARLSGLLPGAAGLFAAGLLWLSVIEAIETRHAIPALFALGALAGASILLCLALKLAVRALAGWVVTIFCQAFAKQFTPSVRRGKSRVAARIPIYAGRPLFSRPPPLFS